MERITFPFSDTIAGYVTDADRERPARSRSGPATTASSTSTSRRTPTPRSMRNLGEPYIDCTAKMHEMLEPGRYVYTYGIFYPQGGAHVFEAQFLVFVGRKPGEFLFEKPDWWVRQIRSLGDFYLKAQFGAGPVDYAQLPHDHQADRREGRRQLPPGDRHHLAPGLRLRHRLPADRRRPLPRRRREGHRVPARAHALLRRRREHRLLVSRHRRPRRRARTRCSPRSSATTSTPSRPTSRSTPWPARSRPTASPATRASCATPR